MCVNAHSVKRNIVLIVLDTVRKDFFDKYGKKIKKHSDTSFKQCRAASSWSVPSHASLFTGELPHQHNIHSESFESTYDFTTRLNGKTLLNDLTGYNTLGVSSNIYINKEFGFHRLFDNFVDNSIGGHYSAVPFPEATTDFSTDADMWLLKQARGLKKAMESDYRLKSICNGIWLTFGDKIERLPIPRVGDNGAKANANAINKFVEESEEPFFVFANFMDAHNPLQNSLVYDQSLHTVPNSWSSNKYDKWDLLIEGCEDENYKKNYRDLYGASIDYLDQVIDQLVLSIERNTRNETTIIVTADHGHNLGYDFEDGHFHHTASLSEGILHVPLEVINPPSDWPAVVPDMFSQTGIKKLVNQIKENCWDSSILQTKPVVAESVGLLGEDNKVNYDGDDKVDHEYWNRMIRCGYKSETKYEWDSTGNRKSYTIDLQQPCWQSKLESDCTIPEDLLSVFEMGISDYKSTWEESSQSLAFDTDVKESLKDLGYL